MSKTMFANTTEQCLLSKSSLTFQFHTLLFAEENAEASPERNFLSY